MVKSNALENKKKSDIHINEIENALTKKSLVEGATLKQIKGRWKMKKNELIHELKNSIHVTEYFDFMYKLYKDQNTTQKPKKSELSQKQVKQPTKPNTKKKEPKKQPEKNSPKQTIKTTKQRLS